MRLPAIAALGAAAYAAFLVATIPASVVASRAAAIASGHLMISEATGTLWNGAAKARVIARGGPVFIDHLEWRLRPARLAAGLLAFDVIAISPGLDARLQVARGFRSWELRDVAAQAEAALVTAFVPWIATWRPEGRVSIASPVFSWDANDTRGEASVEWRNAGVALSEVRPLGSYRLEARAQGGPAQLKVSTLSGPLTISAQGTLTPPSRVALSGEARGEGSEAKALEPLLDLMGPRRPDGARALELRIN
jgi:general secretion pathway protein N